MTVDITTEIDKEANLRTHKVTGGVTVDSLLAKLGEIYSRPDFQADMNSLWDLRGAEFLSMTSSELEKLANFVVGHWGTGGKSRAALVVSRDFEFGLSRMYEIFVESRMSGEVEVFRDLDEALAWVKS